MSILKKLTAIYTTKPQTANELRAQMLHDAQIELLHCEALAEHYAVLTQAQSYEADMLRERIARLRGEQA